jgi:hypothetical protein
VIRKPDREVEVFSTLFGPAVWIIQGGISPVRSHLMLIFLSGNQTCLKATKKVIVWIRNKPIYVMYVE